MKLFWRITIHALNTTKIMPKNFIDFFIFQRKASTKKLEEKLLILYLKICFLAIIKIKLIKIFHTIIWKNPKIAYEKKIN